MLVTQSCPTLCNPTDRSPPGSSVHGISQAGVYSVLPLPSSGDLPDPGIKPKSPTPEVDSLPSQPPGTPPLNVSHCTTQTVFFFFNLDSSCSILESLCTTQGSTFAWLCKIGFLPELSVPGFASSSIIPLLFCLVYTMPALSGTQEGLHKRSGEFIDNYLGRISLK